MGIKQSQQDFLRGAMQTLGMTRDEFGKRFSVPRSTLDKWLSPEGSKEHRGMPDIAWAYIREVLEEGQK